MPTPRTGQTAPMRAPARSIAPAAGVALLLGAPTVASGASAELVASTPAPAPSPRDAGLLVLASMPGPTLDPGTRALITGRHLGGVVLFGANIRSRRQLRALTDALHAAGGRRGFLVTTDQEGGTVRRVPSAGPPISAQEAGRRGLAYVRAVSAAAGSDLAALGIDVDLAPDADLAQGGFIGSRSYGPAPAPAVAAAVAGLRAGGVGATAKHFPGLGGTRDNTDLGPARAPRVRGPALVPFRAAARAGAGLVMIDLAVHEGLSSLPTALSPSAYALLRGPKVGFRGVAVTDALDARAAAAVGSEEDNAVRAVAAGADLVIAPGGPAVAARTVDALTQAVRDGRIPARRFAEAVRRVRALLARPAGLPPR